MGTCPEEGRRRFGTRVLCDTHHGWAHRTRARIATIGYGEHTAPAPNWPNGWAELVCWLCGAGWIGPVGETCGWCEDRLETQRQGQAALVLMEPDVDPDSSDTDRVHTLTAWRARLDVAIRAGTVTKERAAEAVNQWLARHEATGGEAA
jgi:hypothetical protein